MEICIGISKNKYLLAFLFFCTSVSIINNDSLISSDSSAEDGGLSDLDEARLPLEEAFGDEVSGDVVLAPAPLPQVAPAPVVEPDTDHDHRSAVEELVEALARPFTVSIYG